jgi:sterol desaturase/sphingolipid hydroxylase (fatty acid hydroxylase superfamily)
MDILYTVVHVFFPKVILVGLALFAFRLVFVTALEKMAPAHFVPYRKVLPRDFLAVLACAFLVFPAANFLNRYILEQPALPQWVLDWPLAIRVLLYLVLADLGAYWMHRLMHTRHLWRTHKWHHSPIHLYWMSGIQGSLAQTMLQNVPYILVGGLLEFSPWWMFWAIYLKNTVTNDFMHLNVWWGYRWLEWIIVTPRYHHIHHSENPEHYNNNLAVLFPVWDHFFGTYFDPEKVDRNLTFGIGESVSPVRLVVGI